MNTLKYYQTLYIGLFWPTKHKTSFSFFDQTPGLTPFVKPNVVPCLWPEKACFISRMMFCSNFDIYQAFPCYKYIVLRKSRHSICKGVNPWLKNLLKCLEGSEVANSAILDGKKLFTSNQVFRLGSENSKSVILDVKQLFS